MNKTLNKIKDWILVWTGILLVFWIANAWVNISSVTSWDALTETIWNEIVTKVNETGNRVSGIFTDGSGNVWVGNAIPSAKLDVTWNVKIADWSQWLWKVLTSDADWLVTWSDPAYQTVSYNMAWGTVVNSGNTTFNSGDVTLSKWVRLLDIWYYLNPSAINSCFDVHIDATQTSGSFTNVKKLPNFNSETSYAVGRHWYVNTTQLINITTSTALIHARLTHSWCWSASYTVASNDLTMIATKVR